MIIISIDRCGSIIRGYMVSGHAGYGPAGEDIVCAAISMLGQTTLLGLNQYIEKITYTVDDSTGKLVCNLPDSLSETEIIRSQAILETMLLGMKNVQKNYPNYIRVFRRRWTSC